MNLAGIMLVTNSNILKGFALLTVAEQKPGNLRL